MLRKTAAIVLLLLFLNSSENVLFGKSDDSVESHCQAVMSSLGSKDPRAYERHFEHARVPASAAAYANEKLPNSVDLIAVAPVTENDYKTLFFTKQARTTQSVTKAQREEIERVRSDLDAKFGMKDGARDFGEKNFKEVLSAKPGSFVIVVGHNDNLGELRLLDGGSVFLDEIAAAARPNQRVILISCNSAEKVSDNEAATITGKITYKQAMAVAKAVSNFIQGSGAPVSLADVQIEMTKQFEKAQWKDKVMFFVTRVACAAGSAIVVALIIRELDPCKKEDSNCAKGDSNGKSKDKKPVTKARPRTAAMQFPNSLLLEPQRTVLPRGMGSTDC
jgi:hypothetical protein